MVSMRGSTKVIQSLSKPAIIFHSSYQVTLLPCTKIDCTQGKHSGQNPYFLIMPDFRYFELFNLATKPSEGVDITIFPWLKDSDNTLVYDGSAKDSTNGVATERESCSL